MVNPYSNIDVSKIQVDLPEFKSRKLSSKLDPISIFKNKNLSKNNGLKSDSTGFETSNYRSVFASINAPAFTGTPQLAQTDAETL